MQIKKLLRSQTFNQSILTITATILSGILGLLFYMLVARSLGPSVFGIFAVATATLALIADIGDLGTDTGLIRFIGKYTGQKTTQLKFLKLGLEIKILVWILVLSLGWLLAEVLALHIFQKEELINPFRFAFVGVGGALFMSFSSHAFQAFQKYKIWSTFIIGSNLLRLLLILFIIFVIGLNLNNTLAIYIGVLFIFFAISLFLLPKFFRVKDEFSIGGEFFHFNRWIFTITLIAALSSRLDTFLTTRLLPIDQVGVYAVAVQLTSFMPQLFFAIATVVAPKLARFTSKVDAIHYLKKLQLFVLGISILGLLGIPIAYFIINLLYGVAYQESFTPFVILYLAQLIFLVALPTHQAIFYYFAKPQVFVPVAALQLLVVSILGWWLIPSLGIIGAALAVLLGNLFLLFIPLSWVIYQFKKR